MKLRRLSLLSVLAPVVLGVACSDNHIAAPAIVASGASSASVSGNGNAYGQALLPGARGYATNGNQSSSWQVWCDQHAATASAIIGPSGGVIQVGTVRLILPAGALTKNTLITATLPAADHAVVSFEPSGLQFKKPAGLQWDVSGCSVNSGYVPDVVYLNDEGVIVERISATYSNYWRTIAAPVTHFSSYALAW